MTGGVGTISGRPGAPRNGPRRVALGRADRRPASQLFYRVPACACEGQPHRRGHPRPSGAPPIAQAASYRALPARKPCWTPAKPFPALWSDARATPGADAGRPAGHWPALGWRDWHVVGKVSTSRPPLHRVATMARMAFFALASRWGHAATTWSNSSSVPNPGTIAAHFAAPSTRTPVFSAENAVCSSPVRHFFQVPPNPEVRIPAGGRQCGLFFPGKPVVYRNSGQRRLQCRKRFACRLTVGTRPQDKRSSHSMAGTSTWADGARRPARLNTGG